jgi:hypothetical protein
MACILPIAMALSFLGGSRFANSRAQCELEDQGASRAGWGRLSARSRAPFSKSRDYTVPEEQSINWASDPTAVHPSPSEGRSGPRTPRFTPRP